MRESLAMQFKAKTEEETILHWLVKCNIEQHVRCYHLTCCSILHYVCHSTGSIKSSALHCNAFASIIRYSA